MPGVKRGGVGPEGQLKTSKVEAGDRDRLRRALEKQRDDLQAEGDLSVEAVDDDPTRKPDEDANPLAEMNQVIASNRNRARAGRLAEIETALARLGEEPDEFGMCEGCDESIPYRRLELMPWVRLCADCQEQREVGGAPAGRRHIRDYK